MECVSSAETALEAVAWFESATMLCAGASVSQKRSPAPRHPGPFIHVVCVGVQCLRPPHTLIRGSVIPLGDWTRTGSGERPCTEAT